MLLISAKTINAQDHRDLQTRTRKEKRRKNRKINN